MSRLPRGETLLVLACAAGAALLAGSQFTTIFELTPPGGEAELAIDASDQHGYATLVLAVFALFMLVVGIAARTESMAQIAAFAVAASGAVALMIFLVVDLPDANSVGTLDDARDSFVDAKAEPMAGFWFELVGSLILAICGGSLATLGPESLSIGTRGTRASRGATNGAGEAEPRRELPRRPRAGREAGGAIEGGPEPAPKAGPDAKARGGRAFKLPSLPSLPFGRGRRRIGRPSREKGKDAGGEARDADAAESFQWPSRSGRSD